MARSSDLDVAPAGARDHARRPRGRTAWRVGLSLVIGGGCLWLAFPDRAQLADVAGRLGDVDGRWLALFLGLQLVSHLCRAFRWGFLLRPVGAAMAPRRLLAASNVGFLAIQMLPARLGEAARPYLAAERTGVPFSTALGTVVVERVMDGVLMAVALLCGWALTPMVEAPLARHVLGLTAWISAAAFLGLFAVLALALRHQERTIDVVLRVTLVGRRAPRLAARVRERWGRLVEGFTPLRDPRSMGPFVLLSLGYWGGNALGMWALARGYGVPLGLPGSFLMMALIAIAITLPNAPANVGQFHYAGRLALQLRGAPLGAGMAFVVAVNALHALWYLVIGLATMALGRVSLARAVRRPAELGGGR